MGKVGFAVCWTGWGEGYWVAFGLLTHMGLSWQMVSLLLEPRWADTGRAARGLGEQGTLPGDQQATSGGMEAVGQVLQAGDLCQDSQRAAGWVCRQISRDRSTYIIIGNPEPQPGVESWAVSVLGVPWIAEAAW